MKKTVLKLASMFMAATMLLPTAAPAFADEAETEETIQLETETEEVKTEESVVEDPVTEEAEEESVEETEAIQEDELPEEELPVEETLAEEDSEAIETTEEEVSVDEDIQLASDEEDSDEEGVLSGKCGDNITWTFDEENGHLVLSGSGPMYDYESGGIKDWDEEKVTYIEIGEGITYLGNYAFSRTAIRSIWFPKSLEAIGQGTFDSCYELEAVILKSQIKTIGKEAFFWCKNMKTIIIGDSVETIGPNAFAFNNSAQSVYIGRGLKKLGSYALPKIQDEDGGYNIYFFGDAPQIFGDNTCILGGMRYAVSKTTIYVPEGNKTWDNWTFGEKELGYFNGQIKRWKKISFKSVSNTGDKAVTLKWTKDDKAFGYRIQYGTKKNFDGAKSIWIDDASVTSHVLKGLKANTKYYFHISSYRLHDGLDFQLFSEWSSPKSVTVNFYKPSLSSLKSSSKKTAIVKWKKVAGAKGYQIQYSTKSSFKGAKSVKVKGAKTVSKKLTKLKGGKKYYVRIRAYKTVNGKTVYTSWSSKKSVKVKK